MKKLSTLTGIRLVVVLIAAVFLLAGIIFARFFPLSREDHHQIVQAAASRRKES